MPEESEEMIKARHEKWRELEAKGVSRKAIAEKWGVSRQTVAQVLGKIEGRGEREEHHIYMNPDLFKEAVVLAENLGLRNNGGTTAGKGSPGKLLEKIVKGEYTLITVTSPPTP